MSENSKRMMLGDWDISNYISLRVALVEIIQPMVWKNQHGSYLFLLLLVILTFLLARSPYFCKSVFHFCVVDKPANIQRYMRCAPLRLLVYFTLLFFHQFALGPRTSKLCLDSYIGPYAIIVNGSHETVRRSSCFKTNVWGGKKLFRTPKKEITPLL